MKIIKRIIQLICILILICLSVYGYAKYIEPKLLVVKKYDINDNIKGEPQKIKVVQFTDTQLGEFYSLDQLEKVVDKINKQNPDIITFTGDLIDRVSGYEDAGRVPEVLSKLSARLGKFAVWGNHDYGGGGHNYYKKAMQQAGFKVLENETEKIMIDNNEYITISGLDEVMFRNPNSQQIINNISKESYNILLLHEPDLIDDFINTDINLALAGHTHGGQVKLTFVGALITPPYGKNYVEGFYDISDDKNNKIYVNPGLGNTKLVFRFMNIPQIAVFNVEI